MWVPRVCVLTRHPYTNIITQHIIDVAPLSRADMQMFKLPQVPYPSTAGKDCLSGWSSLFIKGSDIRECCPLPTLTGKAGTELTFSLIYIHDGYRHDAAPTTTCVLSLFSLCCECPFRTEDNFWLANTFQLNLRLGATKTDVSLKSGNLMDVQERHITIRKFRDSGMTVGVWWGSFPNYQRFLLAKGVSPCLLRLERLVQSLPPLLPRWHDFEVSALIFPYSSWILIGGGPYSLTLPILNILSLRKQR
ncbi:hypothetical protein J6590_094211 [Homalodisca vitripennis]|nr:hypothetical protein J6590_094211 [Homalodisca vitripennis]